MTQTRLLKLGKLHQGTTSLRALLCALLCWSLAPSPGTGQVTQRHAFAPSDTFHQGRFWLLTGATTAAYTGTVIALNEIWYKDYPRSSFHFFNDWGEWENMDKAGHTITAYFESNWYYAMAKWTGIPDREAQWVGAGMGLLLQSTIEVMDGFSENWGFSVPDFTFNALGSAAFLAQQRTWGEQRIRLKLSAALSSYPEDPVVSTDGEYSTTLRARAKDLYGSGIFERLLKDYNAQTTWISVNISAFLRTDESRFPPWLNVALGYGAEHMYGGFDNTWNADGIPYSTDGALYPRQRQYYLSPDVDLTRIRSKSPFIRTLLAMTNVIKIPAPALELNSRGTLKFHILHF